MINALIGAVLGIISGFGIGGGTFLIIYLTAFLSKEQIIAQGVNLIYFISCAIPAVYFHVKNRLIDKKAMIFCTISGIVTSILSSILANSINIDILQRIFGAFLIYVGAKLVFAKS
ncbi:MAG: TSUP family transporter [Clostridia bacterium]